MNPFRQLNRSHWKVQPSWVKALTIVVAVPAWLVFAYNILSDSPDDHVVHVSFVLFIVVALLQLIFVFRAYWREDI